jgi:hypothetical protein
MVNSTAPVITKKMGFGNCLPDASVTGARMNTPASSNRSRLRPALFHIWLLNTCTQPEIKNLNAVRQYDIAFLRKTLIIFFRLSYQAPKVFFADL